MVGWRRDRSARPLPEPDDELLVALGQANVMLAQSNERRVAELGVLTALAEAVASSSRLPQVLDSVAEVLAPMSTTGTVAVYLRTDAPAQELAAVRAPGWQPPAELALGTSALRELTVDGHRCTAAALVADGEAFGALLVEEPLRAPEAFIHAVTAVVSVGVDNARRSGRERETVESLLELNRMKSEFLASVTEELQTPVAALLGYVRTLRSRTPSEDAERAGLVGRVESQALRLQRVVDRLVGTSSLGRATVRVSMAPVRVDEVVARAVTAVRQPVHRVVVQVPPGLPFVLADAAQLEQVLSRLLSHAFSAAAVGTAVTLTAERTTRGIEVAVHDTGRGFSDDALERLFEPRRGGRGEPDPDSRSRLDLNACREIVVAMGGQLEATSSPTGGSTLTVVLPRLVPAQAAALDLTDDGLEQGRVTPGAAPP